MSTTARPDESPEFSTEESPAPAGHRRRRKRPRSIKNQVTRLALIPSVTLLVLWFVASAILVFNGFYDRAVASSVQQVSIPAVRGLASLQRERQLSMAHLTRPTDGVQQLLTQQQQSDTELNAMRNAAYSMMSSAPDSIVTSYTRLKGYLDQLPQIRGEIDAGAITEQQVFTFYNNLLDAATSLFDTQARVVPDVTATQGALAAVQLFRVSDSMSRSASLVSAAFTSGSLDPQTFQLYATLVGGYHSDLDEVAPDAQPDVQADYQRLTTSDGWKQLVAAENSVISHGPWTHGVPEGLGLTSADWDQLVGQNFGALTQMTVTQADQVSSAALDDGTQQLLWAGIGSVVALAIAVLAILWARRKSRTLVDRALVVRLTKLRDEARRMVEEQLPNIMRRLQDGETIDVAKELPGLQYGADEIGQVATAFNAAQRAAVDNAVRESQARHGARQVFVGIARRNQRPLQRILRLVEQSEQSEQDPARMKWLFQIDHQASQANRNAENLIILGGGELSRRQRDAVQVTEMLRAAMAETTAFERIKLGQVPEIRVTPVAVERIIHLISELLDNAIAFSSPEHEVRVSSWRVRQGVVIQIEDHGLGMKDEQLVQTNQLLRQPPEIDVMALKDGAQLGFWVVAEIAKKLDILVELDQSTAFGGLRAIVRIPHRWLISDDAEPAVPVETPIISTPITATPIPETAPEITMQLPAVRGSGASEPEAVSAELSSELSELPEFPEPESPLFTPAEQVRWPNPRVTASAAMPNHAALGRTEESPTSQPIPDTSAGTPAATPEAPRRRPLPQRQPQQHLVPQLLETTDASSADPADEGAESAEETRLRMSAFQRGTAAGRHADPADPAADVRTP